MSQSNAIFDQLRARIVSDRWPAETRLPPERELAETLGTNRTTLREALRRLEQANLITTRQGQGITVRDFRRTGAIDILTPYLKNGRLSEEKAAVLSDLLEPRAWVFDQLARTAAKRATEEDLHRLSDWSKVAADAEQTRDVVQFTEAQVEWTDALIDASHNLPMRWVANPMIQAIDSLLKAFPFLVIFEPSFADMSQQVGEAIGIRDADEAARCIRAFHSSIDAQLRTLWTQPGAAA